MIAITADKSDEKPALSTILARLVTELGEDRMRWVLERELHTKPTEEQREAVREQYCNDEINVDEDAYISEADTGYWVSGWLWIEYQVCGRCREPHDPKVGCSVEPEDPSERDEPGLAP